MFQMIRGRGVKFRRQLRSSRKRKWIGMHAQTKPVAARGRENLPGLFGRKDIRLAKNVAVLSQLFFNHARQHFVDYQIYISSAARSVFRGNVVGAEKSRNITQRRLLVELLDRAQNLEL